MYLTGFRNHHQTEAQPGALPQHQNSPQQCALGLYAEQISGSAFTQARHLNLHTWVYRTRPSVAHADFVPYEKILVTPFAAMQAPNPTRWSAPDALATKQDFIDGLFHIAGNAVNHVYRYQCNQSMTERFFSNYDAEMLFVPYQGRIRLHTELGILEIKPGFIAVVPRGIQFSIVVLDETAEGFICENGGSPFNLPELGLMGANGLANPRHFLYPTANFETNPRSVSLLCKYQQQLWMVTNQACPLNVVAWHGNYAPYCYDLALFNTLNTVSFDHPDPSIFTVLTSISDTPGIANLDLVVFPPRWMVAQHTFRPPYFHRNIMSEFMGLIKGQYDAKASGFEVGGFSIHNTMMAHGPDATTYQTACRVELKPTYYDNTLAFMFESQKPWLITDKAWHHMNRQKNYTDCWQGFNSPM